MVSFGLPFEKGYTVSHPGFRILEAEKYWSPCKQNNQCQTRVKNKPYFRSKWLKFFPLFRPKWLKNHISVPRNPGAAHAYYQI